MQAKVLAQRLVGGLSVFKTRYYYKFFIFASKKLLLRLFLSQRISTRHARKHLPKVELLQTNFRIIHFSCALMSDRNRLLVVNQLDVLYVLRH